MNFIKHKIISFVFSTIPPSSLCKLTHTSLLIFYYHLISNKETLHIKHLYPHKTVKQFSDDIDYILKHFNPIHLNDLLLFVKKGKPLPTNAMLLTFDDGFREMYDIVAPILLRKGIGATFFINSGFTDNLDFCYQHKASLIVEHLLQKNVTTSSYKQIETMLLQKNIESSSVESGILAIKYRQRALVDNIAKLLNIDLLSYLAKHEPYLTTEQINKLIDYGFTIGAHSIDHPLYVDLSLEEQVKQTIESINFVRHKFNLNYGAFAFPQTDNGVSEQFFEKIDKSGLVDVSFGTSGMIDDYIPHNFQRLSLERTLLPAEIIIAFHFAKKIYHKMIGRHIIERKHT